MSLRSVIGDYLLKAYRWSKKTSDGDAQDKSFNALTPTRLKDDEYELYEKEFAFVFHNPNIRNIALMGSYGAGKRIMSPMLV